MRRAAGKLGVMKSADSINRLTYNLFRNPKVIAVEHNVGNTSARPSLSCGKCSVVSCRDLHSRFVTTSLPWSHHDLTFFIQIKAQATFDLCTQSLSYSSSNVRWLTVSSLLYLAKIIPNDNTIDYERHGTTH